MEIYKAAFVYNKPGAKYLEVWQPNFTPAPVYIPVMYRNLLQSGMYIRVYKNRDNATMAYGFGNNLLFVNPPTTRYEMQLVLNNMRDIYSGKLDSLLFKYDLRRCLSKNGLCPTHDAITNMILYALAMDIYRGER